MKREKDTVEDIQERRKKLRKADPDTRYDKPSDPADDTYKDAGHVDPERARNDKA